MNLAIKEAEKAYLLNEIPIGAILVDNNFCCLYIIFADAMVSNKVQKYKNPR